VASIAKRVRAAIAEYPSYGEHVDAAIRDNFRNIDKMLDDGAPDSPVPADFAAAYPDNVATLRGYFCRSDTRRIAKSKLPF
jgi:hypothetical protein